MTVNVYTASRGGPIEANTKTVEKTRRIAMAMGCHMSLQCTW